MSTPSSTPSSTIPGRLGIFGSLRQVILIVLGMALISSVTLVIIRLYNKPAVAADKVVQTRLEKLASKRGEEAKKVAAYAWIDKNAGSVQLPVERAVELTITELKSKPVRRTEVVPLPLNPSPAAAAAAGN
jgi:hypothetical protein